MVKFCIESNSNNANIFDQFIICNETTSHTHILIDTGAYMPIWTTGLNLFKKEYPDAKKQSYHALIGGFGEGYSIADVYVIADFILTDGMDALHYINLPVAIINKDFDYSMILSFTMFNRLDFAYSSRGLSDPTITFNYDKPVLQVLPEFAHGLNAEQDDRILKQLHIFAQDSVEELSIETQLFNANRL